MAENASSVPDDGVEPDAVTTSPREAAGPAEVAAGPQTSWPALPYDSWAGTQQTVHLWTQIVGKVKLALNPFLNQWWQITFELTAEGLRTGLIPWRDQSFEVVFDFHEHELRVVSSGGGSRSTALEGQTVAEFYHGLVRLLEGFGCAVDLSLRPQELPGYTTPFPEDTVARTYDHDAVSRWWTAMLSVERVLQRFRSRFYGKASPVQFFWGSFDLNHTRFTGRFIEQYPGAGPIMEYGENQENFAVGFWPGGPQRPEPLLYAYIVPQPDALPGSSGGVEPGRWDAGLSEFVLGYEALREADDPDAVALAFFERTYELSARLAGWDRSSLEGPVPR